MFKKINILLVLLLLLISISVVSAADDANMTVSSSDDITIVASDDVISEDVSQDVLDAGASNEILSSDEDNLSDGEVLSVSNTYTINKTNYNTYFSGSGEFRSSSPIADGDTINIDGDFDDKTFIFRIPVNVVGTESNDLKNCLFTFYSGASGSNVSDLRIANTVDYTYGIFLNGASNCVISGCFINNTGQSSYPVCVANNANYNTVTDNSLTAYGITYGHGTRSTPPIVLSGAHYNNISNNRIGVDDANAIYLSSYPGGPLNGGNSNFNIIYNNTIQYNVLPTSWSWGIQIMGNNNTINSNRVVGSYRGISTSGAGNIIINNRIINITGADFENPGAEIGGESAIIGARYSVIVNNTIENAKITGTGAGISVVDGCIVENNTIHVLLSGAGINAKGANVVIKDNFISTISGSGVVYKDESHNLVVSGNNISSQSGVGVLIQKLSSRRMPGNITIINNYISTRNKYSIDARDADSTMYYLIDGNTGPKGTGIVATPEGSYDPSKPIYKFNGTTYTINSTNYDDYINANGYFNSLIKDGDIICFDGEFSNKTIFVNSAVKITGNNPTFYNTKFKVYSGGVWIENLKIRNDRVSNGWGVLVYGVFGATITNCDIDVFDLNAAYAIYVVESGSIDVINNNLSSKGNYLTYTLLAHTVEDCRFINNTIFTNGTGKVYINGGEVCVDGNESCLDGNENCLDGNENCLDGNENCLDGNENCLDGNENCLDGNENCVDGNEVCTDGNSINGNHVLKEVFRTYGILMVYSSNNIVSGNVVFATSQLNETLSPTRSTNSIVGIDLYYNSHNNTFSDNKVHVSGFDNYIYGMGVLGYYTGHDAPEGQGASDNSFINNNIFLDGTYFVEGIVIGDESVDTRVSGNIVNAQSQNVSYGINLEMSQQSIIENNGITLSSDISYGIEFVDSNGNIINNNDFEISAKQAYGFALSNSKNNNFDSNHVFLNVTGENITFKVFDSLGIANAGICLKSNSSENIIHDNNITSLKGYAIVIDDMAVDNIISDNYLMSEMGIGNGAISNIGNNTAENNYAYLVSGSFSGIEIRYLENGTFEFVTGDDRLEGAVVEFNIGEENVGSDIVDNGRATLNYDFAQFTPNQYVISARVSKEGFKSEEFTSALIVNKGLLTITVSDVTGAVYTQVDFTAIVKNILGEAVKGITVLFNAIDEGVNVYICEAKSDENGVATVHAEIPEIYDINTTIIAATVESPYYEVASGMANLTTYKLVNTYITINSKVYPEGVLAILKDINDVPLANKSISISINGKNYIRTTDSAGKITMPILSKGSYAVNATFAGTENQYYSTKNSLKVTVMPSIKLNKNYSGYYGYAINYKVRIVGPNGKYVGAGKVVTIKVAGKTYKVKTDKNGYASKALKLNVGTYAITAEYNKDKVSNKLTVKPALSAKNIVAKKAKAVKFSAKLLDKNGKAFKNKVITFKIKGKKYSAKTNAKGIATASLQNLNVGKYFIYSSFGGYTIKNTVTIKK